MSSILLYTVIGRCVPDMMVKIKGYSLLSCALQHDMYVCMDGWMEDGYVFMNVCMYMNVHGMNE